MKIELRRPLEIAQDRIAALEAELEQWKETAALQSENETVLFKRAETLEADNARLREQVEILEAELRVVYKLPAALAAKEGE